MKIKNPFSDLSRFEFILWISSVIIVSCCFLLSSSKDYLTLVASLIGVTALIFVAKGYVIGQVLTVIFAIFYGIISFYFCYYGEVITYLGMTSPIAILAIISWIKNPFEKTSEVIVNKLSLQQILLIIFLTCLVTFLFYFLLKELKTTNILYSTISVATSFIASSLTFMRSSYYGVAYGLNDIVLIILWTFATIENVSYLPMIVCFVIFLINDIYGFVNWQRMKKRQQEKQTKVQV